MKGNYQMKKMIFALLLTASLSAHANSNTHVFGGTAVEVGDPIASTTVFISGKSHLGYYLCSGSLIAQDIVVTAAHCVVDGDQDAFRIIFMRDVPVSYLTEKPSVADNDPSVRQTYGAIADTDYDKKATQDAHDIAIIRIKGDLPSGYQPATLLDPTAELTAGEAVTLAGYGSTNPLISGKGGVLNKVTVNIKQTLGQTEIVVDQSKGKGGCWGDSGGPAFVQSGDQLLLWGLTNRAFPQDERTCSHGAVCTRITDYADFIAASEATLRLQN
jgi:secreted trypsin-like serine protease